MNDTTHDVFNAAGLRCTRQRKAIYHALQSVTCHPTADELYHLVLDQSAEPNGHSHGHADDRGCCDDEGGLSLATVYNTLEALCKAGLVRKLPGAGSNGSARYDGTRDDHLHLRDAATGSVADAPGDVSRAVLNHLPQSVLKEIEQRLGFRVREVQVELVGEYV